jgi:drug/metabolite transporter (DMT)-like permease
LVGTAVLCITTTEFINKTTGSLGSAMLLAAPLIVVGQICLYYLFNGSVSIMSAWLVFTLGMSAARVFSSAVLLHEPLDPFWLGAGISLMLLAALCIKRAH